MSDPEEVNHFLGCSHKIGSHIGASGTVVRTMTYDMKSFFEQCIVNYEELAGPGFELSNANTLFVEEDDRDNPFRAPQKGESGLICPWCVACFKHDAFVPANAGNADSKTKEVRAHINELLGGNSGIAPDGVQGVLNTIAAKVFMKVFYDARVARPDLLRAIGHLS